MTERMFSFIGGDAGIWTVQSISPVIGPSLEFAPRLEIANGNVSSLPAGARWCLRGVTSYERYVLADEKRALVRAQPPLGRPEATCAALIPVKKSASWWQLSHDERRQIFETRSAHIATGLQYLPAVARRLHHGYDLGEPFDFLTWFEYAPEHTTAFEELVRTLRATEEWSFVDREVDIRLAR